MSDNRTTIRMTKDRMKLYNILRYAHPNLPQEFSSQAFDQLLIALFKMSIG